MKNNTTLNNAKTAKADEFYTRYEDIEKELCHYEKYFKGSTVYCSCDNPFESNFVRYFGLNFHRLGLNRLISSCFKDEEPARFTFGYRKSAHGTVLDYHGEVDDERFPMELNRFTKPMKGNGDFRSEESIELLKEADIIATNPPFSLFRDFIAMMEKYNKKYLVLGNMNAITCKGIFPLIKENRLWWGESIHSGDVAFTVPNTYVLDATNCGIDDNGVKFIRVKGIRWFTNLDNHKRHEGIHLTKKYDPSVYPTYDNYDAIEVSKTVGIPMDYDGVIGVPITFFDHYNEKQFDIVGQASGNSAVNNFGVEANYRKHPNDRGGCGIVNGDKVYARILIRRRQEWNQNEHF